MGSDLPLPSCVSALPAPPDGPPSRDSSGRTSSSYESSSAKSPAARSSDEFSLRKQGMRLCTEIEKHPVWEWTSAQRRSITRKAASPRVSRNHAARGAGENQAAPHERKGTT